MEYLRTILSAQMRIWQRRTGMDNAALAKKANVSIDAIYKLKRCERGASIDVVGRLAKALEIDAFMLLVPVATDNGEDE